MKSRLRRLALPATVKLTLNRMSANKHDFTNLQVYSKPEELTSSFYGKSCDLSLSKREAGVGEQILPANQHCISPSLQHFLEQRLVLGCWLDT